MYAILLLFGQVTLPELPPPVTLDTIDLVAIASRPTESARAISDLSKLPTIAPKIGMLCECGCVEGSQCTCEDCPAKAKAEPVTIVARRSKLLPDGSPDTLAPGLIALYDQPQAPVPTYRPVPQKQTPPPTRYSAPPVRYTYSSGSCANGQCGPARGLIRRGLFGRRR